MGKVWTDEEKDLIRKYKGTRSNKQLAKMLGCTEHQLTYAMRKFNIKRITKVFQTMSKSYASKPVAPSSRQRHGQE